MSRSFPPLAAALALALPACGGDDAPGAGDEEQAETRIEITVWPEGREGEARRTLLTCEPTGGRHPNAEEACEVLSRNASALEPVPGDVACTQIYGGPQEALLEGRIFGEQATVELNRRNGCEIARWDALEPVVALGRR